MRKILLFTALSFCATAPTYADTTFNLVNNTFSVNTAFPTGGVANGSVKIDTSTGIVSSIDVTVVSGGINYIFAGSPTTQASTDNGTQYFAQSTDSSLNDVLVIDVPGSSLIGYSGGNLCSTSNLCGSGYAGYFAVKTGPTTANATSLATGSLAPAAAATPEPSSLVLMGTGLLGAVGAARRRFASKA